MTKRTRNTKHRQRNTHKPEKPMTLRPKSMSTEEAAEYLASGRTNPGQQYAPITDSIQGEAAGWRNALENALVGEEELPFEGEEDLSVSPGEEQLYTRASRQSAADYFADPATLHEQDADTEAVATAQPGLRSDDEIDDDLDLLVGPFALAVTPEDRHRATLRLIDDLVGARQTLRQLVGA